MMRSKALLIACLGILLGGCTATTIDEFQQQPILLDAEESIVVLGRRHNGAYVTEPAIINCITKELASTRLGPNKQKLRVINEVEFINRLYPWFEPRTAPMNPQALRQMLDNPQVAEELAAMNLQYMVWVDGSTQRDSSMGAMSCAIGPGGAGCFGFGSWEDDADYEIAVWDIDNFDSVAWLSAEASGTSYMPAFVAPIPLIARVKTEVCNSVADQISAMFSQT